MDRQLEIALPASQLAESALPFAAWRRDPAGSSCIALANYRPEVPYALHPAYVLLAGAIAAAAIFYANSLFEFSTTLRVRRGGGCGPDGGARPVRMAAAPLRKSTVPAASGHDPAGDKYRSIGPARATKRFAPSLARCRNRRPGSLRSYAAN